MHIKGKYSWAKHLDFMLIDLIALAVSFFTAYFIKNHSLRIDADWGRFLVIVALFNIVIDFVANPYSGIFRRRYYQEIGRAFLVVFSNAVCASLLFFVFKIGENYSREVVIVTYALNFCIAVVLKYFWKKLLTSGKITVHSARKMSLFLISSRDNAEKDIHSVYSTALPLYDIKGVYLIPEFGDSVESLSYRDNKESVEIPVIHKNYKQYILDNNVEQVLVGVPADALEADVIRELTANGVGVDYDIESMLGFQTEEQFVTNIGVKKALSIGTFSFSPSQSFYFIIKRLFDILCGLLGLVILIPVTILVKIAYLISGDNASIFYRQKRVGLNGKIIRIWKYRSMVPNAGEILQELLKDEKYRKEWEENQKFEDDPRITKVGAILRKTSLARVILGTTHSKHCGTTVCGIS